MGNEQKHTQFKKQLEKEALEKITFWVILGCLLFCVPVFGLNFFNLQFSADEHLDFLNRAFDITYGKAAAYLNSSDNRDVFLSCIAGRSDGKEAQYSLGKYNLDNPVNGNLILLNRSQGVVFSSFAEEQMNLHRQEFSKIVCTNARESSAPIYNAVYYLSGDYSEYVLAKALVNEEGSLMGFALLYLDGSDFGSVFSEYQYDSIITDRTGDVIYCSKRAFLSERSHNKYKAQQTQHNVTVQGIRYVSSARALSDKNVVLYSFIYFSENSLYVIIGVVVILLLGCIWTFIFLRLSKMMAEKTAHSVEAIVSEIRIIRHGDNDHIINIETGDEFEEIAAQINKMVKSINELNIKNTDLIKLNSMIEMRNLQTQINPHFIYNTLDNIKYLILTDAAKASDLIERFTHILRYSIDNTRQDVFLSEDMQYIEDYLYIQQTRFGERFICHISIDPCCEQWKIPKLLLQPMIENSIKYGFMGKMELSVWIKCRCEGQYLILSVEDNGPGVSPEELAELQKNIVAEEIKTVHNGLQNISRRIMLEYGEGCGLCISSVSGSSFTVTAKLLCRRINNV